MSEVFFLDRFNAYPGNVAAGPFRMDLEFTGTSLRIFARKRFKAHRHWTSGCQTQFLGTSSGTQPNRGAAR